MYQGMEFHPQLFTVLLKNFVDNALEKFRLENNPMILKPEAVCKKDLMRSL